jgi:hypothetical protein
MMKPSSVVAPPPLLGKNYTISFNGSLLKSFCPFFMTEAVEPTSLMLRYLEFPARRAAFAKRQRGAPALACALSWLIYKAFRRTARR